MLGIIPSIKEKMYYFSVIFPAINLIN